jgi:Fe-S oxidoreductase
MAVIRRYILKPERLDNSPDDAVVLAVLFLLTITGFIIEALRISAAVPTPFQEERWSFAGFALARFFGLENPALLPWYQFMWWFHVIIFFGAVIYLSLSFSKLFHIIISPLNIFFRSLRQKGALTPIADLEEAEKFGTANIEDFTWKQLLDLDACTACGRCQASCPAHISGKTLSPKRLIQDMKTHLEGKFAGDKAADSRLLIGGVIAEDDIWSCTTCRACQEVCPVFVEHIDKIIEMRRNLTLTESRMPESVQLMVGNLFSRGHPWTGAQYMRLKGDWMTGLELNIMGKSDTDTLLWVGCTGALTDRNAEVTRSLVRVLQKAEVNFAVWGAEEPCCGDPSRRIGFEVLSAEQAQQNIAAFQEHGIKKIITSCPHCFNAIKNEYPQWGGVFEVLHHSQLLAQLLKEGKLKPAGRQEGRKVTYHDSCYLGRYNDIFHEPREILRQLPRLDLIEMPRYGQRALCCGGGGGRIWMEEAPGNKVNRIRTEEAVKSGSEAVVTACPFCLQMFDEGIRAKELDKTFRVMDLAEVVEENILSE